MFGGEGGYVGSRVWGWGNLDFLCGIWVGIEERRIERVAC